MISSHSRTNRLPRSGRARRVSRVRRLGRLVRLSRRHVPVVAAIAALAVAIGGGGALALSGRSGGERNGRAPAVGAPIRAGAQQDCQRRTADGPAAAAGADNGPTGAADNGPTGAADNGPTGAADNGPTGAADNGPAAGPDHGPAWRADRPAAGCTTHDPGRRAPAADHGVSGFGPAPTPVQAQPTQPAPGQPPQRFTLVAPGAALPTGAQCAAWVRATPSAETKAGNSKANQRTGHRIDASRYSTTDVRANQRIAPRVDGQFTGSTRDILRWAACKWGFDEDFVFAQAAVESWWLQSTLGDWTSDADRCAPGHGPGADGRPGECPESFGIVQTRYPYMTYGWPGIGQSTAMVADLGYANLRTCFEGYEGWLNGVELGRQYGPGDVWGCAGRYMSGRWYTAAGNEYVTKVRSYLNQRIWETPDFQQS